MTKKIIVQIYEIQTPVEAEAVIEAGTDHVGSVLLSGETWKNEIIRETVETVNRNRAVSSLIPLFNTPDTVFRTLDYYRPDIVHFCESLADESGIFHNFCRELIRLQEQVKERFPEIRIMRSIPIARPGSGSRIPSLELGRMFAPVSDFFLTDTLLLPETAAPVAEHQPVNGFVGITGKICDRDVAAQLVRESRIPVILAGGIDPDNVYEGIMQTRPAGVDSCTGTNALDPDGRPIRFRKDMEKVRQMAAETCRAAENLFLQRS